MITLTRQNLGPYRLTGFKQHETSRGVYWSGTLTCNGASIGFIENRGDGGATHVAIDDPDARRAFKAFVGEVKPQIPPNPSFPDLPKATLDWEFEENFAGWLSDEADLLKSTKRKLKQSTVIVLTTDPEGTTRIVRSPYSKSLADAIRAKYGESLAFIVNEVLDQFG